MARVKTVADLVKERLGVSTFHSVNPVTGTVGVTATPVARQNPNRVWMMIVNLSVNDVVIGPFPNVSLTQGILLAPSGGNIILDYTEDFEILALGWSAIAAAAGSSILVLEQVTDRNQGN